MRYICVYQARETSAPPDPKQMAAVGNLIADMNKAGVLLATEGCTPSANGHGSLGVRHGVCRQPAREPVAIYLFSPSAPPRRGQLSLGSVRRGAVEPSASRRRRTAGVSGVSSDAAWTERRIPEGNNQSSTRVAQPGLMSVQPSGDKQMLKNAQIVAYIPVADLARARRFYEQKVGL